MNYNKLKQVPVATLLATLKNVVISEEVLPRDLNAMGKTLCRLIRDSIKYEESEPEWGRVRSLSLEMAQSVIDILKSQELGTRDSSAFLAWLSDFYIALAQVESALAASKPQVVIDEAELLSLLGPV